MPGTAFGEMMVAVIATFRVARQTSRWARFAAVTVEVVSAIADEVTVADGVLGEEALRHEALCGGLAEALRHLPAFR